MRVLLCAPYGGCAGGIARWTGHIVNYYQQHQDPDLELQVLSVARSEYLGASSKIHRIFAAIHDYRTIISNLKKSIEKYNPEIIHLTSSASLGLVRDIVFIKIAHRKKIKVLIHFRFGRIPELFDGHGWEKKLIQKVIRLADWVIVIDQKSYNVLKDNGYKNISILPNPVSPQIEEIVQKYDIERECNLITFVGHVVPAKGIFELIEACKKIDFVELRIVGTITSEIKGQIVANAGDWSPHISFVGEVSFEDSIKEMMRTNVFVLPTYTEGFPNVILESMACGCPIVSTPVGAIPEMLDINGDNNCGICVPVKSIDELQFAIEKMLNNPEFAMECGQNAKNRVYYEYGMESIWRYLNEEWNSLL